MGSFPETYRIFTPNSVQGKKKFKKKSTFVSLNLNIALFLIVTQSGSKDDDGKQKVYLGFRFIHYKP